jgi:dihydropteroate synthase
MDLSRRPLIMGVLNVTPDSFSDGACFLDTRAAIDRALRLEDEGADIIDIGGESTRPSAEPVPEHEELRRVMPVLQGLSGRLSIPLSIDTYKASVAKAAMEAGAEIVNDISALTFDSDMASVVAATSAAVVLMHTRGGPQTMQSDTSYGSLMGEIVDSLRTSLSLASAAGVHDNRIVVDPGIGFGKSPEGNLQIVKQLSSLQVLGRPILVGTSRKSFIGKVTGRVSADRLAGTAATVAVALMNGASVFRVHDVGAMRDVVDVAWAIIHS